MNKTWEALAAHPRTTLVGLVAFAAVIACGFGHLSDKTLLEVLGVLVGLHGMVGADG